MESDSEEEEDSDEDEEVLVEVEHKPSSPLFQDRITGRHFERVQVRQLNQKKIFIKY